MWANAAAGGDEVPVDHDHGVEIEGDGRIALQELRPQEPAGRRPPMMHPSGLGDSEHAGARRGDPGGRLVEAPERGDDRTSISALEGVVGSGGRKGSKRRDDDHVELSGLRQRVVHRQGHRCRRGHSPFRSEDGEFDRVDPRVDIAAGSVGHPHDVDDRRDSRTEAAVDRDQSDTHGANNSNTAVYATSHMRLLVIR